MAMQEVKDHFADQFDIGQFQRNNRNLERMSRSGCSTKIVKPAVEYCWEKKKLGRREGQASSTSEGFSPWEMGLRGGPEGRGCPSFKNVQVRLVL